MIGPFIRTVLSLVVGVGCILMARSAWFTRRLEVKYADFEDAENRIKKGRRDWILIGVFWLLFGAAQMMVFY